MGEPWQWDTDAIKATAGAVRAGRSLAPETWSSDATAAVALSFDSDHDTIPLPAVCALPRPGEVRGYADRGQEVALHGWIHERNAALPPGTERELTLRAADTLTGLAAQAGLAHDQS